MKHCLAALALLVLAAPAAGEQGIPWKGIGWYVLAYDGDGWLEITAGPYAEQRPCKVEADRQTVAESDYTIIFLCRDLQKQPRPDGKGGLLIWYD